MGTTVEMVEFFENFEYYKKRWALLCDMEMQRLKERDVLEGVDDDDSDAMDWMKDEVHEEEVEMDEMEADSENNEIEEIVVVSNMQEFDEISKNKEIESAVNNNNAIDSNEVQNQVETCTNMIESNGEESKQPNLQLFDGSFDGNNYSAEQRMKLLQKD